MQMLFLLFNLWLGFIVYSPAEKLDTPNRQVAITFDDLPASYGESEKILPKLIYILKKNQVPATGFINEAKLYENNREVSRRTQLLRDWLRAGLDLGNHSFSHVSIDQVSVQEYKQEIIRGEKITKRILGEAGKQMKYYRHTQLRTGPTQAYKMELEKFLKEKHYTIAPVTIDNDEYIFAHIYARAKARKDTATMNQVVNSYIPYMDTIFAFYEKLSTDFLEYEPKQILLLHANELNADHMETLLSMMKKRDYQFISLDEALEDKAYLLPDAQANKGYSWIQRWMLAKGLAILEQPQVPLFISELFEKYPNH
ncbi:polysaccharide deacetylase family protein [Rhodocytophaga rosea]|uniref:Polysaccharide deacetylase family protein n=1 Tax=Rhodocytophaga rosea TaxID=2704465 RepID=A0A6C0GEK1_9BACT|nr:polysaccharide deacetylase family protein [Rhodocytophaga rosea]QHT66378.1 polysaccharide deacetylase family protein [Rhodocytophaga rosea]